MSYKTSYLCTDRTIKRIEELNLSLNALRLLHALQYYVDANLEGYKPAMAMGKLPPVFLRSNDLLELAGTPSANDLNTIIAGVADMPPGIFDTLCLSEDRRSLQFRFTTALANDFVKYKREAFAIIDIDILRRLHTVRQIKLYTRMAMAIGADFPKFRLPWAPQEAPWPQAKRRWIATSSKVSKVFDVEVLLLPAVGIFSGEVDHIDVKLVAAASKWHSGTLYPRDGTGVIAISQGCASVLTRDDVRSRRRWRRVSGP